MDLHVLTQDPQNKTVDVVFHVAVPAGNNAAGVAWSTAVVQHLAPVSTLPGVSTTEANAVAAGTLLEVQETVRFSSVTLTNAQRLAQIRAAYTARSAALLDELGVRLNFWGYQEEVA